MHLALLTTQTTHHTFFVNSLLEMGHKISVFLEVNRNINYPFKTFHEFENERDQYENKKWFNNELILIENLIKTYKFKSINSLGSIQKIKDLKPDIIIVFGTGIIKKEFINASNCPMLNLHGGDPEKYRGLDSHLWSIYHKDYDSLVTSIHLLDEELDNGEIIFKGKLNLNKDSNLVNLRSVNTELCVNLSKMVINMFLNNNLIISSPQISKGRYYSAMPMELKSICLKYFDDFIQSKLK